MKKLLLFIALLSQTLILHNAYADRIDRKLKQNKNKIKNVCADYIRCGEGYPSCARNLYNTANRAQRDWRKSDSTQCSKFMKKLAYQLLPPRPRTNCYAAVQATASLLKTCWNRQSQGCTAKLKSRIRPELKRDCGQKIANKCIRLCTRGFSTGCYRSCREMIVFKSLTSELEDLMRSY